MAVNVPEPDYYELAELAKRWDVSRSYLLRLGVEGKLELAWPIPYSIYMTVASDELDDPVTVEEMERLFPDLSPEQLQIRVACRAREGLEGYESLALHNSYADIMHKLWTIRNWDKIEISVSGLAIMATQSLEHWDQDSGAFDRTVFTRVSHFTGSENTVYEPPIGRSFWRYEIRESITAKGGALPPLPEGYYFEGSTPVTLDELVVPTNEVHRIEGLRKEAEKAATADVLGGSAKNSRNILLTIIKALCTQAGIDPKDRGATSKITQLLELQGTPAAERTVRDAIKDIPEAMRSRRDK
jgi:hypothetical protein